MKELAKEIAEELDDQMLLSCDAEEAAKLIEEILMEYNTDAIYKQARELIEKMDAAAAEKR